jgi:hypothetical protein
MNASIRLFVLLFTLMIAMSGFSQQADPEKELDERNAKPSGSAPLKKIPTHKQALDLDIDIDEQALEADIERAMQVELNVEDIEIQVEEVDPILSDMNIVVDPVVEIDVPEIEIEPEMDYFEMKDIDIDIDEEDFQWDREEANDEAFQEESGDKDKSKDKEKNKGHKEKDRKEKKDKQKVKGLKKIN